MNAFKIQVQHDNTWANVSTIEYDPTRDRAMRAGDTIYHTRKTARDHAHRALEAWRHSHQFIGRKLRIAELVYINGIRQIKGV